MGREEGSAHLAKHGVDFAYAATVFQDELARTVPDHGAGEERFSTLDPDVLGGFLAVVYARRGDRPRMISERKATLRERRTYEGHRR